MQKARQKPIFVALLLVFAMFLPLLHAAAEPTDASQPDTFVETPGEPGAGTESEEPEQPGKLLDSPNDPADDPVPEAPASPQQDEPNESNAEPFAEEQEYDEAPAFYVVRFFDYDGAEFTTLSQTVASGGMVEPPYWLAEREGMTFLYWFVEEDAEFLPFRFDFEYVYDDINLIARYALIPDYYETPPSGFNGDGKSGTPNLAKKDQKSDAGQELLGEIIDDGNLKGVVVEVREGAGFIVAVIHVDEASAALEGTVTAGLSEDRPYELGETITLVGHVEGFEGAADILFQWQRSADGFVWVDEDGATGQSYSFVLTEENCGYKWRLDVYVVTPALEEAEAPEA